MKQLGLRTYDDIVDYLSFIEEKYKQVEEELSEIKIGVFTRGKADLKAKKQKLEKELERYTDIYDYYDNLFREATTFERKDFSEFIAKYFSVVFGKTYEVQRGVRDISESKYAKQCDFIASTEDFEKLDKKYDLNGPVKMSNVIEECSDTCLYLGGTSKHTIFDDSELNSDFADFPEILEAGKRLIDLKLLNPGLSDKKRLMIVLRNIIDEKNNSVRKAQPAASGESMTEEELAAAMEQTLQNIRAVVGGSLPQSEPQGEPQVPIIPPAKPLSFGEDDEEPFQPIHYPVHQPTQLPNEDKKLSKSLMGRYMSRR